MASEMELPLPSMISLRLSKTPAMYLIKAPTKESDFSLHEHLSVSTEAERLSRDALLKVESLCC
jgi:hypothetical protein